jgi:hypothetical protein
MTAIATLDQAGLQPWISPAGSREACGLFPRLDPEEPGVGILEQYSPQYFRLLPLEP